MADYHVRAAEARAAALTPEQRREIARQGGEARAQSLSPKKRIAIARKANRASVLNAAKRRAGEL